MSTTNTSSTWYWYLRNVGDKWYLGIVDQDGDASASALTVEIYYDTVPARIENDDFVIPLRDEYMEAVIKKTIAEICEAHGVEKRVFLRYHGEFERMIGEAVSDRVNSSEMPAIVKPVDIRAND